MENIKENNMLILIVDNSYINLVINNRDKLFNDFVNKYNNILMICENEKDYALLNTIEASYDGETGYLKVHKLNNKSLLMKDISDLLKNHNITNIYTYGEINCINNILKECNYNHKINYLYTL